MATRQTAAKCWVHLAQIQVRLAHSCYNIFGMANARSSKRCMQLQAGWLLSVFCTCFETGYESQGQTIFSSAHPDIRGRDIACSQCACVWQDAEKVYPAAEASARQGIALMEASFGDNNPRTSTAYGTLAAILKCAPPSTPPDPEPLTFLR